MKMIKRADVMAILDGERKRNVPRWEIWRQAEAYGALDAIGRITKAVGELETEEERPRGRWLITEAFSHRVYCSVCYKTFAQTSWAVWEDGSLPRKFCPNCGAVMEEEVEE